MIFWQPQLLTLKTTSYNPIYNVNYSSMGQLLWPANQKANIFFYWCSWRFAIFLTYLQVQNEFHAIGKEIFHPKYCVQAMLLLWVEMLKHMHNLMALSRSWTLNGGGCCCRVMGCFQPQVVIHDTSERTRRFSLSEEKSVFSNVQQTKWNINGPQSIKPMNPMASNCIVLPKLHCVKQWLTGIEHIDVHLKTHTQRKKHTDKVSVQLDIYFPPPACPFPFKCATWR